MGATLVEKIFSSRCGKEIEAGDVVMAAVDRAMIHDITGPLAVKKFGDMNGTAVFEPRES